MGVTSAVVNVTSATAAKLRNAGRKLASLFSAASSALASNVSPVEIAVLLVVIGGFLFLDSVVRSLYLFHFFASPRQASLGVSLFAGGFVLLGSRWFEMRMTRK